MSNNSRKKSSKLGHDPLAWLEDDSEAEQQDVQPAAVDDASATEVTATAEAPETRDAGEAASAEPPSGPLPLPASFNISQAAAVHSQLCKLADGEDISLDAGPVETIDTSAIQLLLAARQHAETKGVGFEILNPPDKMRNIASLLNVSHRLGLE